jgi:hypothetical protein
VWETSQDGMVHGILPEREEFRTPVIIIGHRSSVILSLTMLAATAKHSGRYPPPPRLVQNDDAGQRVTTAA